MNLIKKILSRKEIVDKPPVLIDVGASGQIHKIWKKIAPYSICVAFDADDREFGFVTNETSGYKKLHIFNCIVCDKEDSEIDFYLTKSPYCSSALMPDNEALNVWAFADKFRVEKKIKLKAISLNKALQQVNLNYVDWFKTDSQGTDLRLFNNLGDDIIHKILVAEFEPGFIDAYKGEDKLYQLLGYMENKSFWLANLNIKGSQRITVDDLQNISKSKLIQKLMMFSLKTSPGWAESTFINKLSNNFSFREYLLSWVFSTILQQYGFAYSIALQAQKTFSEDIFLEMEKSSRQSLKTNLFKLKFFPSVLEKFSKILKVQ